MKNAKFKIDDIIEISHNVIIDENLDPNIKTNLNRRDNNIIVINDFVPPKYFRCFLKYKDKYSEKYIKIPIWLTEEILLKYGTKLNNWRKNGEI